ncbi:DUF2809 domain-containing protein [soil metagenome]
MLIRRIIYFLFFAFFIWLALATRHHKDWFHPLIVKYGGDVIWAAAFLFLLRVIFIRTVLWKVAACCYTLGVLDELSQLINTSWADNIRSTTIGKLMFGVGFVWSDLLCYLTGTLLAWGLIAVMEHYVFATKKATHLNE